jgi:predicted nucleotidyltransferase component of viral defense system
LVEINQIKADLRKYAKENKLLLHFVHYKFFFEKFLYRISISKYQDFFVLRGGLLLYCYNLEERGTKDIDLILLKIPFEEEKIKEVISEICKIEVSDFIFFDSDSIRINKSNMGYNIHINGYLGQMNKELKIDLVPSYLQLDSENVEICDYPTIFGDNIPKIKISPIESIIADKFESIFSRTIYNSRMKDFFDIYIVINKKKINGNNLKKAIIYILIKKQRIVRVKKEHIFFLKDFIEDENLNKKWDSFLKKLEKEGNPLKKDFASIMLELQLFFKPIYQCILKNRDFFLVWNPNKKEWEKINS